MASDQNWKPIEDVVIGIIDRRGVTPTKLGGDFTSAGHRVVSAKLMKGGRLDLAADEPRFVAQAIYKKWMRTPLQVGDVLMTSEAPLGELAYMSESADWCLGQRLFALRPKADFLDGRFLYYALQTDQVRADIHGRASGTTVLGIRQAELRKVKVPVPNMGHQRGAAELLGSIDDRIDVLRQTNTTLEAIAQTLFKSWFVDFDPVRAKAEGREPEGMDAETAALFPSEFEESELGLIPKGWLLGRLGDYCHNVRSQARPQDLQPETEYIGLEHMPRGSIAPTETGRAAGLASGKFWYQRGDVLFGKLRPYFHKVIVAANNGVCSTDILVVRAKEPVFFGVAAMHLSSRSVIEHATQVSNGAKMPRCNWGDLDGFPVVAPPREMLSAFDELARPIVDAIHSNIRRTDVLSVLRDTLLPRLISGKLRLPEAEATIEESLA